MTRASGSKPLSAGSNCFQDLPGRSFAKCRSRYGKSSGCLRNQPDRFISAFDLFLELAPTRGAEGRALDWILFLFMTGARLPPQIWPFSFQDNAFQNLLNAGYLGLTSCN